MIFGVPRALRVASALLGLLGTASCGDEEATPPDNAAMHITLPNDDLALVAGTADAVRVVIVRNGYEGQLTLRAEGVPSGVSVPDVFVTKDETEASLLFTASSGVAPGISDVKVLAEGDSVETSFRILRLSIRPPGSFSVSAEPIALLPGSSGSATVFVSRNGGFNGTVTLSVSAPVGLTASVQPADLAGSASNTLLTVIAASTLRPGAYSVRIVASSPGFPDETFDVTVTVSGS